MNTNILIILALLGIPVLAALLSRGLHVGEAAFRHNGAANGYVATISGAIAGNVGIGAFIAIFLFAANSPVTGFAVVAPAIRRAAARHGVTGLVDLLVASHGVRSPLALWIPVAIVFILRSAVQIGALGILLAPLTGGSTALGILTGTALIGLYLVVGGYRAAVGTDILQAAIIMAGTVFAAAGLLFLDSEPAPFLSLGPYNPALLAGIAIFLPWTVVLAVDNWQRVCMARSTRVAVTGYIAGAVLAGSVFLTIAFLGYLSPGQTQALAAYSGLMPAGMAWLATLVFVAAIMSSVDTFIMPLALSFGPESTIRRTRILVAALLGVTAAMAILLGDVLANVIAAFNSLTAFLPAALGAVFLRARSALPALVSMNLGVAVTAAMTLVDRETAAFAGFACAALSYGVLHRWPVRLARQR